MDDRNVKIHVSNLRKCFGDLEVLQDISTDIYEGEVVVILGPSGSGKSTFLRCLNRLEEKTSGEIVVDGKDIYAKGVDINKMREDIGIGKAADFIVDNAKETAEKKKKDDKKEEEA